MSTKFSSSSLLYLAGSVTASSSSSSSLEGEEEEEKIITDFSDAPIQNHDPYEKRTRRMVTSTNRMDQDKKEDHEDYDDYNDWQRNHDKEEINPNHYSSPHHPNQTERDRNDDPRKTFLPAAAPPSSFRHWESRHRDHKKDPGDVEKSHETKAVNYSSVQQGNNDKDHSSFLSSSLLQRYTSTSSPDDIDGIRNNEDNDDDDDGTENDIVNWQGGGEADSHFTTQSSSYGLADDPSHTTEHAPDPFASLIPRHSDFTIPTSNTRLLQQQYYYYSNNNRDDNNNNDDDDDNDGNHDSYSKHQRSMSPPLRIVALSDSHDSDDSTTRRRTRTTARSPSPSLSVASHHSSKSTGNHHDGMPPLPPKHDTKQQPQHQLRQSSVPTTAKQLSTAEPPSQKNDRQLALVASKRNHHHSKNHDDNNHNHNIIHYPQTAAKSVLSPSSSLYNPGRRNIFGSQVEHRYQTQTDFSKLHQPAEPAPPNQYSQYSNHSHNHNTTANGCGTILPPPPPLLLLEQEHPQQAAAATTRTTTSYQNLPEESSQQLQEQEQQRFGYTTTTQQQPQQDHHPSNNDVQTFGSYLSSYSTSWDRLQQPSSSRPDATFPYSSMDGISELSIDLSPITQSQRQRQSQRRDKNQNNNQDNFFLRWFRGWGGTQPHYSNHSQQEQQQQQQRNDSHPNHNHDRTDGQNNRNPNDSNSNHGRPKPVNNGHHHPHQHHNHHLRHSYNKVPLAEPIQYQETPAPRPHETIHAQALLLGLAFCAIWSPSNAMAPNLTEMADFFNFDHAERDLYLGSYCALATGVLSFPIGAGIGILADMVQRKYLFCGTMVGGALSAYATGQAQSYTQFIVARLLNGGFMAGSVPVAFSFLGDLFAVEERNAASSGLTAMMGLGIVMGQVYAGMVGPLWGWQQAFHASAVLTLCLAVVCACWVQEPERGGKERVLQDMIRAGTRYERKLSWAGFWHACFQNASNSILLWQGLFSSLPWGIIFVFLNDYLSQERGFSVPAATFLVFLFGLGCAAGGVLGGYWGGLVLRYFDRRYLPLFMALTTELGILPFVGMLNIPQTRAHGPLGAVFAFGSGLIASVPSVNVRPCLINVNPPETRGAALTAANLLIQLGRGVGPSCITVLGGLANVSRQAALNWTLTVFWTISTLQLIFLSKTLPRDQDAMEAELAQYAASAMEQAAASARTVATGIPEDSSDGDWDQEEILETKEASQRRKKKQLMNELSQAVIEPENEHDAVTQRRGNQQRLSSLSTNVSSQLLASSSLMQQQQQQQARLSSASGLSMVGGAAGGTGSRRSGMAPPEEVSVEVSIEDRMTYFDGSAVHQTLDYVRQGFEEVRQEIVDVLPCRACSGADLAESSSGSKSSDDHSSIRQDETPQQQDSFMRALEEGMASNPNITESKGGNPVSGQDKQKNNSDDNDDDDEKDPAKTTAPPKHLPSSSSAMYHGIPPTIDSVASSSGVTATESRKQEEEPQPPTEQTRLLP